MHKIPVKAVKATLCSSNFPAVAISAPSGETKQLFLFCLLRQLTGLLVFLAVSEVFDRVHRVAVGVAAVPETTPRLWARLARLGHGQLFNRQVRQVCSCSSMQ